MSLKERARETLAILGKGWYTTPSGKRSEIGTAHRAAVEGTRLFTPQHLQTLLSEVEMGDGKPNTKCEVTNETTQKAAYRMIRNEGCENLVLLNFASARNPGGGFMNGAKAQEEDLARCSGLYPALLTQPAYYEVNRQTSSIMYTDHMIYTPSTPFFRVSTKAWLEEPFTASVITAPAPNAARADEEEIRKTFKRRAGLVLALARHLGHRNLLLGAWGCGAFGNKPQDSAGAFGFWLEQQTFIEAFDRVVFAVWDKSRKKANLNTFSSRFNS